MTDQRYEIRPLGPWIGPVTRNRQSGAAFRAPWSSTLNLLGRETLILGARLVVIQVDVTDGDLRRDGMLRANARVGSPGVKVSFDSRHGPLTYATDEYAHWQANVRAVALSLQALRAVDRYGVSKSGEQYKGWTAIGGAAADTFTAETAARFIFEHASRVLGGRTPAPDLILRDRDERARAYKAASRCLHPDAGGSAEQFRQLSTARELLDAGTAR